MTTTREHRVEELTGAYVAGGMSRRVFISRLLPLGLSTSAAGTILAACSAAATPAPATAAPSGTAAPATAAPATSAAASGVATGLKGNIRFLIGPWTNDEVKHHQVIQTAFNQFNPDVTFTYKLFDWATGATEITNSLASGSHDIFYIEDHDWIAFADRLEDLTSRQRPGLGGREGQVPLLGSTGDYGGKLIGMPLNWHVVDCPVRTWTWSRRPGSTSTSSTPGTRSPPAATR